MKRNTLISILISFFKTGILLRNEKIWVFTTKRLIDSCKKFLFVISLISELTSFVVIVENYEKSFEINSQMSDTSESSFIIRDVWYICIFFLHTVDCRKCPSVCSFWHRRNNPESNRLSSKTPCRRCPCSS